jgi:hypothetical protein
MCVGQDSLDDGMVEACEVAVAMEFGEVLIGRGLQLVCTFWKSHAS